MLKRKGLFHPPTILCPTAFPYIVAGKQADIQIGEKAEAAVLQ